MVNDGSDTGYAHHYKNGKITTFMFAGVLFICALISSIELNHFETVKEHQVRRSLVKKLENPRDVMADYLFKKAEEQITHNGWIFPYFNDTTHNIAALKNRIQKLYFDGYLSKFDFKIHVFNANGKSLSADNDYSLEVFKEMVLSSSFKVSKYFYRESDSFGFQSYFAILPVNDKEERLGSIVIELKSKALQTSNRFPELLIDGNLKSNDDLKNYSYAFYFDDKLVAQSGAFVYKLVRDKIQFPAKTYNFKTTDVVSPTSFRPFATYSHLIYKPTDRNLIVISKEENAVYYSVTSVTFFLYSYWHLA
ncbi:hypothetical protein [Mucilaginibacter antarcticus]|uniref:hypothetical protein n=1 Tax=Mucilaginibacter antarcticus TaxID=1855725 RepID=UPI00363E48B1